MHRGIKSHPKYLDESNLSMIKTLSFVFLCIDKGSAKKVIIEYLISNKIPFIDVGLDVSVAGQSLLGTTRSTLVTEKMKAHIPSRITMIDRAADEYTSNIQIADLNALNAIMAVIKWKKYIHFYQDEEKEYSSFYSTNINEMFNEDHQS